MFDVFDTRVQCDAVCCSVLQCVAVCCSVSQRRARVALLYVWCDWQEGAVCCSVLQCVAVCCSALQCVAVTRNTAPQCNNMFDTTHLYMWDMTHWCVIWRIYMCDMTHWYVWHDSIIYVCRDLCICMTWLIRMCHMTYWYVWHDSCIRMQFGPIFDIQTVVRAHIYTAPIARIAPTNLISYSHYASPHCTTLI